MSYHIVFFILKDYQKKLLPYAYNILGSVDDAHDVICDLTWLPEPIATERADHAINTKEIISYSTFVLLEFLNPKERAVFILKNAFDYSHQEIADIFSITVDNSKQLLRRAKKTLKEKGSDLNLKGNSSNALLVKYVFAASHIDLQLKMQGRKDRLGA